MALTTAPFTAADLVAMISETWTPVVLNEMFAKGVAQNFFTDLSPYAVEGSDIFHVPDLFTNAHSVSSQSTHGAEVTTSSPTQVDVTLTVDSHRYIALLVGDMLQAQLNKNYDLVGETAKKVVGTLVENTEDAFFALHSSITTNTVNDTASVLDDTSIRQAVEKLATADVNLSECAFFLHPYAYWVQVIQIAKYYDASQAGWGGNNPIPTGNFGPASPATGLVGQLFGIPIYQSSRVVNSLNSTKNLLAHKNTIGFAFQTPGGSPVRVRAQEWLENLGILTVFDLIRGVGILRQGVGVVLNASNAFIAS